MPVPNLNALITRSQKADFETLQSVALYAHDPAEVGSQKLKGLEVDASGNLKVAGSFSSSGGATEAKQDDIITEIQATNTALAGQLDVSGSSITGAVSVSNFPTTQSVSGSVAVSALPAVSGTVDVGNFPTTQAVSGSVAVSSLPAVSGAVDVNNFPTTQAISATALPLPALASTSTLQTTGNTSLNNIDNKITQGTGATVSTAQQVLAYGRTQNGVVRAFKTSGSGVQMVEDHADWATSTILASTAIANGNNLDVDIDLGDDLHIPDDICVFITNSAGENTNYSIYLSHDGVNWFQGPYTYPINFSQSCMLGLFTNFYVPLCRYYRLNIDNAGTGSSNYTVVQGVYS